MHRYSNSHLAKSLRQDPKHWVPLLLTGLLLVVLFGFSLVVYDGLPERIPVHFNADGTPTRWELTSWGVWLSLPLVAAGLTLLMCLSAKLVHWAKKHPVLLNIPYKRRFLTLPQELQLPVWERMKQILYWMTVPMNGLFLYLQVGMYYSVKENAVMLRTGPVLVLIALVMLVGGGTTVLLIRDIRKAIDEYENLSG